MIQPNDISCLIFASGASTRFGSSKMLHKLHDGHPLLSNTIGVYKEVFEEVNVVVREGDQAIIRLVENSGANCILNAHAANGLSQSIVTGVRATSPARGWLFALGDMPYLLSETLEGLVEYASNRAIVLPRTSAGNGNPVIFGATFKNELLKLTGDIGAKPLVTRYRDFIRFYDCADAGVHHDIDQACDVLPHGVGQL